MPYTDLCPARFASAMPGPRVITVFTSFLSKNAGKRQVMGRVEMFLGGSCQIRVIGDLPKEGKRSAVSWQVVINIKSL